VSLLRLLTEATAPYEAQARAAGSSIEVVAPDQQVRVDPVRIRQAVHNLLDNAIRHGGGPEPIVVSGRPDDGVVRIEVADGGPGFPRAVLDRAFEAFSRGSSPPGGESGTGLGLAIVKAVAEAHGGPATAANSPAHGARVALVLKA
ncbi:MAG TPA: ATP-binding protein, partial [Streptosporangiaceae bacterium]